jgi:hypothetical protein
MRYINYANTLTTYPSTEQISMAWSQPSLLILQITLRAEPFFRSRQLSSYSRTSQHFMEPEGTLLCSQEPSTDPYPEPDQSNPSHPISLRSILILSTYLRLGLPSGLFPFGFPTYILYAFLFSSLRATRPANLILLDLITLIILGLILEINKGISD